MQNVYRKCIVKECNFRQLNENFKVFSLPKNIDVLEKWCTNLKISVIDATAKKFYICSRHFKPEEYTQRKIINGALPTLNLGYVPDILSRPVPKKKYRKCCFKHCHSTSETHILFSFPKDEERKKIWCSIANTAVKSNTFMCQVHFDQKLIKGKILDKSAIPTYCLPCEPSGSNEKAPPLANDAQDMDLGEFENYSDLHVQEEEDRVSTKEDLKETAVPSVNFLTSERHVLPDIDQTNIRHLKALTSGLNKKENLCSVTLDENALKSDLEHDPVTYQTNDFIDLGQGKKQSNVASKCLVFMPKSNCSYWEQILSYYPVNEKSRAQLEQLLKDKINPNLKLGLVPKMIVSDQGSKPKELSIIQPNKVKTRHCGLKYCNSTSKTCRIFSFPQNKELRDMWNKLVNVEYKMRFLCQFHFKPEDVRGKYLAKGALPSKNLRSNFGFNEFVSPTVKTVCDINNSDNTSTVADAHIAADSSTVNITSAVNVIDSFSASDHCTEFDVDKLLDIAPADADIHTDITDVAFDDIKTKNSEELSYLESKIQIDEGHENEGFDDPGPRQFGSVNVAWLEAKVANFEERLSMLETRLKIIEEKYPI